jgi:uncharacterized protein (TIGR02145 family)
MKNRMLGQFLLISFCLLTSAFLLQAQVPQGIPYQAIARNSSGQAIANTAVRVRFSIRDSIANGTIRYRETHNPTTSALGLFSVNVGMGTVVSGTFSGINWGKNAKFLQVELDPAGGTTYTDLGTTQMMSVPYALQANAIKFRTSATGDTLYTGGGNYVIIPGLSASNPILNQPEVPVTDIEGNVYQTVRIGTQVWMKENLKVSKYRNGNSIPTGLSDATWASTTSGAYAIYNNLPANNTIYGKLYNWYAVADPRGLCPVGWHVPSDNDWKTVESFLGMTTSELDAIGGRGSEQNVGGKAKAVIGLWIAPNTGANNISGFSGLPSGYRNSSDGSFIGIGEVSLWVTSTEGSPVGAATRQLYKGFADSFRDYNSKSIGYSVRCLRD